MIRSLYKVNLQTEQNKLKLYDKIYDRVCCKIRYANNKCHKDHTSFEMPNFNYGIPCYNKLDCCLYIKYRLNNEGFDTTIFTPDTSEYPEYTLYIEWKLNEYRRRYLPRIRSRSMRLTMSERSSERPSCGASAETPNIDDSPYSYLGYDLKTTECKGLLMPSTGAHDVPSANDAQDVARTCAPLRDDDMESVSDLEMLANKKYVLCAFDKLKS